MIWTSCYAGDKTGVSKGEGKRKKPKHSTGRQSEMKNNKVVALSVHFQVGIPAYKNGEGPSWRKPARA